MNQFPVTFGDDEYTPKLFPIVSWNLAEDLDVISSSSLWPPLYRTTRVRYDPRILLVYLRYTELSPPPTTGVHRLDFLVTVGYMSKLTDFISAYRRTFLEGLLVCGGRTILIIIFQYIVYSHIYHLFRQKLLVERPIPSAPQFHPSSVPSRQMLTVLKYLGFTCWVHIIVGPYHLVNLRYIGVASTSPNQ
jgi:hypothetical protein